MAWLQKLLFGNDIYLKKKKIFFLERTCRSGVQSHVLLLWRGHSEVKGRAADQRPAKAQSSRRRESAWISIRSTERFSKCSWRSCRVPFESSSAEAKLKQSRFMAH